MNLKFLKFWKGKKLNSSLRLQIALLYILLAVINIIYFSVMIFENQMDLLISNFKYHADSVVNIISNEVDKIDTFSNTELEQENLVAILKSNGIFSFQLLNQNGSIVFELDKKQVIKLPENINEKISEINAKSVLVKTRYNVELDSDNFLVKFLLPIQNSISDNYYIYTELSIKMISDRLKLLYFQIILSVCWGIIFHILFAIYLFRVIFKRLENLGVISEKMAEGELDSRVDWKFSNNDELDKLGLSFNKMAANIESSMLSIKKLNNEIQRELEIGKQVQTLFLPEISKIKRFNPAIYYRPMREVSGDIYNFFDIDDRFKAVFIADATGHGVSAAIVTTVIQMSLNSILLKTKNPMKIMNQLCRVLLDVFDSNFMASGVFFLFDHNKKVYISNSAHNPPLLLKKRNNKIIEIKNNGSLLGMLETTTTTLQECRIAPGDRFLMYTDGLTEAKNDADIMYGLDKVKEILLEQNSQTNQEILDLLILDFTNYVMEYKDDVTAILIEVPENA